TLPSEIVQDRFRKIGGDEYVVFELAHLSSLIRQPPTPALLHDLVGALQYLARHGNAEIGGRLQVDRELEFFRLAGGKLRGLAGLWLTLFENAVDQNSRVAPHLLGAESVGSEPSGRDEFFDPRDRRQSRLGGERRDLAEAGGE